MVQIAKAWAVNRVTGEEKEIAARDVDKKRDADFDFLCPDKCCRVPLTHYSEHLHTFIDPDSDPEHPRAFKLNVASHFRRKAHAPAHDEACKAVDDYTKYQLYARANGGLSHQNGAFVFNLNIPTTSVSPPLRQKPSALTLKFQQRVIDKLTMEEGVPHQGRGEPRSIGLRDVEKLAGLLDVSAFDPKYRESILLRDGPRIVRLSEIYKDDPIKFYREEHERARQNDPANPVLVQFKPIAIGKYHSKQNMTIQGLASPIIASNGKAKYAVSMLLHCGTEKLYEDVKTKIRDGERSFLVFASDAHVNLIELAHKKKEMEIGNQKDNAVFVHLRINRAEQITSWAPPRAQLELALDAGVTNAPAYSRA